MRHWRILLASVILFTPSVVFVSLFCFSDPPERGTLEFDRTTIECTATAEEPFTFMIIARNTDTFRSARIVSFHKAC